MIGTIFQNIKLTMAAIIVVLVMLLLRQCDSTKEAKGEITRMLNNNLALEDTLEHYIDENGLLNGEIRGLALKLYELDDKIDEDKPPVTIIQYVTEIRDSIIFQPSIDTVIMQADGTYTHKFTYTDTTFFFESRSKRIIDFDMPLYTRDSILRTGEVSLDLKQDIWLEASILQNKNKEVFVNLKTDYPGVQFNNAQGILVENDKQLKKFSYSQRKQFGIGMHLGVGYSDKIRPYVGIGVHYSPKFLQW